MAGVGSGIVIDVGCATHGGDRSIEPLIERFHPEVLFGFDPQVFECMYVTDGTVVVLSDKAAWTVNGRIRFDGNSLGARVVDKGGKHVRCFDLAQMIAKEGRRPLYLKLDCEGSEYPIIEKLIKTRVDATIDLLLVEWHCQSCGHGIWSHAVTCDQMEEAEAQAIALEDRLACPVERWEL
jgi:FkbM family methyltransferase